MYTSLVLYADIYCCQCKNYNITCIVVSMCHFHILSLRLRIFSSLDTKFVGSSGLMVRAPFCRSRGQWFDSTSIISKFGQFRSPPLCLCLSEETVKAVGSFYLVSVCAKGSKRSHAGKWKKTVMGSLSLWRAAKFPSRFCLMDGSCLT